MDMISHQFDHYLAMKEGFALYHMAEAKHLRSNERRRIESVRLANQTGRDSRNWIGVRVEGYFQMF